MKNTNLVEATAQAFQPLCVEFGLQFISSNGNRVRYSNGVVNLDIRFDDRHSYEVAVDIMLCDSHKCRNSYSLDDVRKMFGDKRRDDYSVAQATTQNELSLILSRVSKFFIETGSSIFSGDKDIFVQLEEMSQSLTCEHTNRRELRRARQEAESAWKNGKHQDFLDLMTPFATQLSKSELMKMSIAEKHKRG